MDAQEIKNASKNAETMKALLIKTQQEELQNQQELLKELIEYFDKENKILTAMPDDSENYEEQAIKVEEASVIVALTKEAIAQYQMNLIELGVEI